jgi:hypothetical protein
MERPTCWATFPTVARDDPSNARRQIQYPDPLYPVCFQRRHHSIELKGCFLDNSHRGKEHEKNTTTAVKIIRSEKVTPSQSMKSGINVIFGNAKSTFTTLSIIGCQVEAMVVAIRVATPITVPMANPITTT